MYNNNYSFLHHAYLNYHQFLCLRCQHFQAVAAVVAANNRIKTTRTIVSLYKILSVCIY